MKLKYSHPELDFTKLFAEDILTVSDEVDLSGDKEVEIDGGPLYGGN